MGKVKLTEDILHELGKVPDAVIANNLNVTIQTIYKIRLKLNIPACRKHDKKHYKKIPENVMIEIVSKLPTNKDADLARMYEVSREYIRQIRLKHRANGKNPRAIRK